MPSSLRLGQVSQGRPLAQWPLSVALATAAGKGNTDSVQAWYGSSSGSTACGWGLGLGPAGGGVPRGQSWPDALLVCARPTHGR